jgi:hypothetical protein
VSSPRCSLAWIPLLPQLRRRGTGKAGSESA